jgi:molybdopterin/thiamine biosynthesis adenylyltransferase
MSRLVLTSELLVSLRQQLLESDKESCAILFGRSVEVNGKLARIVVRDSVIPSNEAYSDRTRISAQLRPEFVGEIAQHARQSGESIIFVHTHPFGLGTFSDVDDAGETALAEFLARRVAHARHAALLITPKALIARELGTQNSLQVVGIGPRTVWGETAAADLSPRFDRQIRVFGASAQGRLRSIRVGIVGLGGTGSVVLQQLAHLGVRDFVFLDPDVVDETNLNRLVGAKPNSIGRPKVDITKEMALSINPDIRVEARRESVLDARVARSLVATDFLFNCTDSHGSRAVVNQLAYQYLLPTIDLGVVIAISEGKISHVMGRVQLLAPGLACLTCANLLDPEQIRRDLLTESERKADPYILGGEVRAPAVISLNSTVASLAITMFLNTIVGIPGAARFLNYDAITGVVRPAICPIHPSCVVCSHRGALARGDEWPLPARYD